MEAQRGARPSPEKPFLQKTLRPESCDWIDHRLPLENPPCHRKAKGRIEQVHRSHRHPPIGIDLTDPLGEIPTSTSIGTIATDVHVNKAQRCHRSGTEV